MSSTHLFKTVVDTVYDSVSGYEKAAEKANSPSLKAALNDRLNARRQTLDTLNAQLKAEGDELVTKGTFTGTMHRTWLAVTDAFENGDEAAAERIEEGEDYLIKKFKAALDDSDLRPAERTVLERCYAEVQEGERFGDMIEKQYD